MPGRHRAGAGGSENAHATGVVVLARQNLVTRDVCQNVGNVAPRVLSRRLIEPCVQTLE